jgi:hypothetical protein
MSMMVRLILNISFVFIAYSILGCSGEPETDSVAAVSLFDGKSFAGWEGDLNWFRIEDSAIVAGSLKREIPHNQFLCTTKAYGDFELKVEVKLVGEGANSGIQFRSRRIPENTEVIGYQADIGGAIGDWDIVWGNLYDESRRNKMLVTANSEEILKVIRPDDWNEMTVKCQDKRIQVWLNGYQSVDYFEEDESIEKKGVIGIQIHSGAPAEAWFRNIRLTEL